MADLLGDDRPPSRRLPVLAVAVLLLLGGYAVIRHLSAPQAAPADASPTATATPTPPATRHSAIPSPYSSAYPASAAPTPVPRPWAGLPVRVGPHVDFAAGDRVVAAGRNYRLDPGDLVLAMDRGAVGPVVLVQSRGSTSPRAAPARRQQARAGGVPRRVTTAPRPGCRPDRTLCGVRDVVGDGDRTRRPGRARPAHRRRSGLAEHPAPVRRPRLGDLRSGAHGGPRPRWAALPMGSGAGPAGTCDVAGPRTRWAFPAGCCAVREQLDGHRGRLHRARRRPRGGAGPAVLPEAARGAGRLVAGRRSHRGSRGPTRARGPRPAHRTHHPARHPGAGVRLAGGVGRPGPRARRGPHPRRRPRQGAQLPGGHGPLRAGGARARAVGRRTSCCPADDRQRGSIPHCSRVSQSCSTRSSSASSSRDAHRASAASSPGTGLVGPATMQA